MAAFGFTEADYEDELSADVWELNAKSVEVFGALKTQWREAFGGKTGLDYSVLPAIMDLLGVAPDDRAGVFSDIRVMEMAALNIMAEQR